MHICICNRVAEARYVDWFWSTKKRRVEWIPSLEEAGGSASKRGFSRHTYTLVVAFPKAEFSLLSFERSQLEGSSFRLKLLFRLVHETRSRFVRTAASTKVLSFTRRYGEEVEKDHGEVIRLETSREIFSRHYRLQFYFNFHSQSNTVRICLFKTRFTDSVECLIFNWQTICGCCSCME